MNSRQLMYLAVAVIATLWSHGARADWTDFRGGAGFVSLSDDAPPADWSVEDGRNVAWAVDLPGRGVSGPIVVGDRVFVTASDGPERERLHVAAYDARDGSQLWRRQMWATGRTLCHGTSAVAAPTPASDGSRVFAFYSSNDLACYDLDGALLWYRPLTLDHPGVGNDVGMASSPVVAGDVVVVLAQSQRASFLLACDRATGATVWEVERPKGSNWTSPLPIETESGSAVVVQGRDGVVAHDAASGEVLWRFEVECDGVPSLAGDGERLVLPTDSLTVVSIAGAAPETLLRADRIKPGSPSPVVWLDRALVINRAGVLTCGDLATGEIVWRRRLGGRFWSTPVVAGGRLLRELRRQGVRRRPQRGRGDPRRAVVRGRRARDARHQRRRAVRPRLRAAVEDRRAAGDLPDVGVPRCFVLTTETRSTRRNR